MCSVRINFIIGTHTRNLICIFVSLDELYTIRHTGQVSYKLPGSPNIESDDCYCIL